MWHRSHLGVSGQPHPLTKGSRAPALSFLGPLCMPVAFDEQWQIWHGSRSAAGACFYESGMPPIKIGEALYCQIFGGLPLHMPYHWPTHSTVTEFCLVTRELHVDRNSLPFPPITTAFVPIPLIPVKVCLLPHLSLQRFIPVPTCPGKNSSITADTDVSPHLMTVYHSWFTNIISDVMVTGFERHCQQIPFCHWRQNNSSISVKCSISSFLHFFYIPTPF